MYLYIRKNIIISIKKLSLCNRIMIYETIQSFKVLKTWEMKKGNCRETECINLCSADKTCPHCFFPFYICIRITEGRSLVITGPDKTAVYDVRRV